MSSRRGEGATERDHHKRLNRLKEKGPLKWHTSDPARGSKKLALKNGVSPPPSLLRSCEEVLTVDFIAMLGEYVGTVLFMIFALGGTK